MKRSFKASRLSVPVVAAVLLALSSCNRGYGCPTNFSIEEVLGSCVQAVLAFGL